MFKFRSGKPEETRKEPIPPQIPEGYKTQRTYGPETIEFIDGRPVRVARVQPEHTYHTPVIPLETAHTDSSIGHYENRVGSDRIVPEKQTREIRWPDSLREAAKFYIVDGVRALGASFNPLAVSNRPAWPKVLFKPAQQHDLQTAQPDSTGKLVTATFVVLAVGATGMAIKDKDLSAAFVRLDHECGQILHGKTSCSGHGMSRLKNDDVPSFRHK
ncbi:MAG: hypothetical protein AAF569_07665 [Pseudomonadota bacterium]